MSTAHDWKRYDMDWYICATCGSRISILADYERTKYGCTGPLHIPEKAQFTAVDMANADANGFKNGRKSVGLLLSKGFNTLETVGGKYKIVMQFAVRDDAWAAYTELSTIARLAGEE